MSAEERFTFALMWVATDQHGVDRDQVELCAFESYGTADMAHRRACAGGWVTPDHRQPEVGTLAGVVGDRVRPIRSGQQLWVDPRGPFTDEDRQALRERLASAGERRTW